MIKFFFKSEKEDNLKLDYDVIIHIGAPKTGTSAIQNFLLKNRKNLLKNGYHYPCHKVDKNEISGGHSDLGLEIINNNLINAAEIFRKYIEEAKKNKSILLISAESLFFHSQRVREVTKNYRCKIIVFFRDPMEATFSSYNQGVKRHFQTLDINSVCQNILNQKNYVFSKSTFEKWVDFFGKENITIVEYNLEYFKKNSIEELFLSFLAIDKSIIKNLKPKNFKTVNKSYNFAQLELKRLLNNVLDKDNHKLNNELDLILQKLSNEKDSLLNIDFLLLKDIENQLRIKFSNTKKELLKLGMISNYYPKDKSTTERFNSKKITLEIFDIVNYIKKNNALLYKYLTSNILIYQKKQNLDISYEINMLCNYFNLPMIQLKNNIWFNNSVLDQMATKNYQSADFLREIAKILINREDYKYSDKFITKALELRPNAPGIIKLKEQLHSIKKEKDSI